MGKHNIQRLKDKIGLKLNDIDVDIYFELIDRIYYQDQGYIECEDIQQDIVTWFFEDGRRISLNNLETVNLALFLMKLYNDADEQLLTTFQLENSWRKLK